MRAMVKEGERLLVNWRAERDEFNETWVVVHYVGGEEYEICDGEFEWYYEARHRAEILNAEKQVYEYMREWEGDEIF